MPKSSKRFWNQSPSLANPEASGVTAKTQNPNKNEPLVEQPKGVASVATKSKPKVLTIPFAFGIKLMLDNRLWHMLFFGFWLYIYAAFTANEWLYLLAGGFFVAAALGILIPLEQILEIKAECSMPEQITVSEWVNVKLKLSRNFILGPLSALIPIQALRLRINLLRRIASRKAGEYVLDPEPLLIKALDEQSWLALPTPELARGIYSLDKMELLTCFPFGLTWWSREINVKSKDSKESPRITVHPMVLAISGTFLHQLWGQRSTMGLSNSSSIIVHQSSSVRSVREYKPGDSVRHVHWPSSAKQGKIFVREFDSEQLPVFDLLLDLRANWQNKEQFELAVCLIHSLVHLGYKLGIRPELILNPPLQSKIVANRLMFDLPQIPEGLDYIAEILARVEPITAALTDEESSPLNQTAQQSESESSGYAALSERPLITIIPRQELIVKYIPEKGDQIVAPVEVAIISRNWAEEDDAGLLIKQQAKPKKAALSGQRSKTNRAVGRPSSATILATISGEAEAIAL